MAKRLEAAGSEGVFSEPRASASARRQEARRTARPAQPAGAPEGVLGRVAAAIPRKMVLGGLFIFLVLLAWEMGARNETINPTYFSSPILAVSEAYRMIDSGFLWPHLYSSGSAFVVGVGLAIVFGVSVGILIAWYKPVGDTLEPAITALYSIPRIAIIPLLILIAGFGMQYKVTVVTLLTFFPILLNTIAGIKNVDPSLVRMSRSFGARDWQLFLTVALPSALPFIVAGIRQAVAMGLTGVVAAEFFASRQGLGWIIARSSETFQTDRVYATVLVLAILGVVMTTLVHRVEARFARWRG